MVRVCEHCGKSYRRTAGAIRRRFCSIRCVAAARFGQKQLSLKVFRKNQKTKNGNATVALKSYKKLFPRCQRCDWNQEPAILHVHHRDRDRRNFKFDNLETLCPTCHVHEHFMAKDSIWGRYKKIIN
jgi:5-methylcytosine-specific restriction endonuclease McrA